MESILVTGGSGMVGQAIREISCNYSYTFIFVGSKDYDLTSEQDTRNMFVKYQPTYVIHLAAYVGGLYKNMTQLVQMLEKNVSMNLNVIKMCHEFKVKKVIACLSTCIFPDQTTYPINENMLHTGPPHESNAPYAYAKRLLDIQCAAYRSQYDSPFLCVIPTNLYGRHDQFDLQDAHVIPALIHQCYLAKQNNTDFKVKGTGKPLRQFVFAPDMAARLLWILENADPQVTPRLIIAPEEEVTIKDMVNEIVLAMNFDTKQQQVVWDSSFSDGQYKKTADGTLLHDKCQLPWTSLSDGIRQTVNWFLESVQSKELPRGVHT
jgi:GDP-L-fucose synthase